MLANFVVGLVPKKECRSYARNEVDNFIEKRRFNLAIIEDDSDSILVYGDSVDLQLFTPEVSLSSFVSIFSKSCGVIELPYDEIIKGNLLREEKHVNYYPYYDLDASKPHLVDRDTMASVAGLIRSKLNMSWKGNFVRYKSSFYIVPYYPSYNYTIYKLIDSFNFVPKEKALTLEFMPEVSNGI